MTAPYLHDGSASTLQDAIKVMRNKANHEIHTTAQERELLTAYLMQIDSKTKQPKAEDDDGDNKNKGGSLSLSSLLSLLALLLLLLVIRHLLVFSNKKSS